VVEAIQNLFVFLEMGLLFAPLHRCAFPVAHYRADAAAAAAKKKE